MRPTSATNDFVLLYLNGEVEGDRVGSERTGSTPVLDGRAAPLHDDGRGNGSDRRRHRTARAPWPPRAHDYVDEITRSLPNVGADGEWIAEDLMEGVYEVVVDLPAGYVHVDAGGVVDERDYTSAADTYFSQQPAVLMGGRADADTEAVPHQGPERRS